MIVVFPVFTPCTLMMIVDGLGQVFVLVENHGVRLAKNAIAMFFVNIRCVIFIFIFMVLHGGGEGLFLLFVGFLQQSVLYLRK